MPNRRGNPRLQETRNADTSAANSRRKKLADDHSMEIARGLFEASKEFGEHRPYGDYASWLNENGYVTRRGHQWTSRAVSRVFKRALAVGKSAP